MQRALPFLEAITGEKRPMRMVYVDAAGAIDLDDYLPQGRLPSTDSIKRLFRELGEAQRNLHRVECVLREWGAIG